VYQLDSGAKLDHSEFAGANIVAGTSFISDSNGVTDCAGHGTSAASVVIGRTVGVAQSARLVVVRMLDCRGAGSVTGTLRALEFVAVAVAAAVRADSTKRSVVNLSIGTPRSASINAAVASLAASGVVPVIAAGNTNVDACSLSPASETSSITVGATDSRDRRSTFSNYGPCVDLFAPGTAVTVADFSKPAATKFMDGTSFAAPAVTGAVARLLQQHPSASVSEVCVRLRCSSTAQVTRHPFVL
jgi:subtilisin family serine protease